MKREKGKWASSTLKTFVYQKTREPSTFWENYRHYQ